MAELVIQPLTRVEGHGRVELTVEDGRLSSVRVALIESPRLFEAMVVGRAAVEVPELVCRVCAICSAVHKLAALTAIEQALEVDIPLAARLVRDLLLLGGHIQSHALHLFLLILPDLAGTAGIADLLRANDPLAKAGLELKAFGNRLQEVAGGRVIHPVIPRLGGVARRPASGEVSTLQAQTAAWLERWPEIAAALREIAHYPPATPAVGVPLATGMRGDFALAGAELFSAEGVARPVSDYADLLGERPVSYSRARQAAGECGPFLVGALARRRLFALPAGPGADLLSHGIHANNEAQCAEIGWALQQVGDRLAALAALAAPAPLATAPGRPRAGIGTAAFEAPRGLLLHRYVLDDRGRVAAADIVTPTAINQRVMERQLLADLEGVADEGELRRRAERVVRAYDPCISCAVHVIQGGPGRGDQKGALEK